MNLAREMVDFVSKMMEFAFKMMKFALIMTILEKPEAPACLPGAANAQPRQELAGTIFFTFSSRFLHSTLRPVCQELASSLAQVRFNTKIKPFSNRKSRFFH